MNPSICPQCNAILLPNTNFCPNCGYRIAPEVISIGRQIWIYFVSLFLPPLGLIWTFKYLFKGTDKEKRIAYIAALLTIVSTIVTIWMTVGFLQNIQSQMNQYQNLGI